MLDAMKEWLIQAILFIRQYLPGGGTGVIGWLSRVIIGWLLK